MDPGEAFFKGLVRLWRRVRGHEGEPAGPGAAWLSDHADRLELLAAMLFDDALDAKPAEDVGGVAGSALLLPSCVDLFDDAGRNVEVYLYRVAWGWASRVEGFEGAARGRDPLLDTLCTLLAVPATRERLHAELPATAELTAGLEPAALAARPEDLVRRPGGAMEALVRRLLGDREPLDGAGDPSVRAWLDVATGVRPAGRQALQREAERLLKTMIAANGRGDPPPGVPIWGALLPLADRSDVGDEALDVEDDGRGGRDRKVVELDRTSRLQRQKLGPREDKPLYHVFEKIETAEDYSGQSATPDASGSPDQMEDAIRDLTLGTVVRTPDDPRNLVRADVVMEPTALEVGGGYATAPRAFTYPEWSFKKNAYREDWCTVMEERYLAGEAGPHNLELSREILRPQRRHVDDIRGHMLRALYTRRVRNRQTDGPEIDVEAMVERHADLTAGHTPPDRLYLSARKTLREIAILVLLDTSWSTDAWLEGRRVLDIELSALLVVAEAFEGYIEEEVAVASFRSHTRRDVRFGVLKGFEDSWQQLRRVAPSLRPDGYTRIGAAVRHATAILEATSARKKLLVVLSDGKPTDYDRYEGRYGIEDVSRAIREARQQRIHTFGIAIEKEAKLYLARMLGPGSYRILPRPAMLPDVMAEVFLGMLTD